MKAKPKMIVTLAWNVILVYRVTKTAKSVSTIEAIKPTVCFYDCIHPYTIPIIYTAVKMKTQTTSKKCQYKLTINNLGALYESKPRVPI